ncbi:MAG: RNHCP domain-containing protein [Chloroflexota bacterium]|nr:RNHCP domain-containing protein [Chloroflexota bacterium]
MPRSLHPGDLLDDSEVAPGTDGARLSGLTDLEPDDWDDRERGRKSSRRPARRRTGEGRVASGDSIPRSERTSWLKNRRADGQESFRCRHCRQMIGPTVSGGRHRNHCPLCLYSRHVDDRRPGDRASTCGSVMAPVGLLTRRNGEQVILHRCLGCGREKPNRIAADDNDLALESLSPLDTGGQGMADALALMDVGPS